MNLKLLGKNTLVYGIGQIGIRASSFILIPLYTHSLSIKEYGMLVTLLLTIQILITLLTSGTETGLLRFIGEYEAKNQIGCLIGSSIAINISGGAIISGLSLIFLKSFFQSILHTDQVFYLILLTCMAALSQSLYNQILTYYRAKNDSLKFMFIEAFAMGILILANLIFLRIYHLGASGVLIAQIITYGGIFVIVAYQVISVTGIGVSRRLLSKLFKFGFPLILSMSGGLITDSSAMYFLSYFSSLEEVAVYSLGYKLASVAIMAFITPFQLAYEPFVFNNINTAGIRLTISKLLTYLMIGFAFVALGIIYVSRPVLPIIAPPEYFTAYLVVLLVLPGIAFKAVFYIGSSLLHVRNKTYVTGTVIGFFTVISVLLNYALIPLYGRYGVIIVFNFTLIGSSLVLMVCGLKSFPIPLERKRLIISGVLLICFLLLVFFLRITGIYIYYSLIPVIALISIALLYCGGFFDDQEKITIRNTAKRFLFNNVSR